jgi:hypothetical protein
MEQRLRLQVFRQSVCKVFNSCQKKGLDALRNHYPFKLTAFGGTFLAILPSLAIITNSYTLYLIFWFIRLMRRWTKQIRDLELFGEKNRLGRGSNLGQAGGNLCRWGPERFFSIARNAQYT